MATSDRLSKLPVLQEIGQITPEHTCGEAQSIFGSPKILCHPERLDAYLRGWFTEGEPVAGLVPVTMELDLTNICSHACRWCVGCRTPESKGEALFAVDGDGEQIATARAADYIAQMARAGVRGLIMTGGGEPTVHADLVPLVVGATNQGMDVGLITHGGLLHKHSLEMLVEHCTWIRISIDAANEREFEAVHGRGQGEWDRVWCNVERLVSAKRALEARGTIAGATIGLAFLTGPHNADSIVPFAQCASNYGVDYAQLRPFHRFTGFDATPQLRQAQALFDSGTFKVVGSVHKYSIVDEAGAVRARDYSYCHIAHFASVICANEKMYACCHYRNQEQYCIGDLRTHSFREILSGHRRRDVLERIKVGACLPACRGDHVNRQVQKIMDGNMAERPQGAVPSHVNFL
jgi:MoaA/NifB/PqqE/SkfB family radical SAM enzyme